MQIFVKTWMARTLTLEVESDSIVENVKAKLQEFAGLPSYQHRLVFEGKLCEDCRTLAFYNITNESTLHLIQRIGGWQPPIYVKTEKWKIISVDCRHKDTIYQIKSKVEVAEGIPWHNQLLLLAGKELEDHRTLEYYKIAAGSTLHLVGRPNAYALDIAAIQARRKAARSKAKGTGDRAEASIMLPNVGSKRAREDSSSTLPQHTTRDFLLYRAIRTDGVESFWDEEDSGLARRRSQALISPFVEFMDDRTLIESVANNCVRTLTNVLEQRLLEYKDRLKQLTEEGACVKELLRKEKDRNKKLRQELDMDGNKTLRQEHNMEHSTGTFFLQSDIATLAKSAVDGFKKSGAFQELLMEHSVRVYDKTVKEIQRLLRESGRVSEDIVQLIDPQESDKDEDEEDSDSDK